VEPVVEVKEEPQEQPWKITGELFDTYIIVQQGERALLIDKHAAHERMNFDRLKAEDYQPMVQQLLTPAVFTPAAQERQVLAENLPLLAKFGFKVEEFGSDALIVRQAPFDVDAADVVNTLTEIAAGLLTTGRADPSAARDHLLHTMACKAAIKGGWKSGPQELERVAKAVMDGSVKYCPHGRPVAIELTRKDLEKQFKRA
jgi:DNA mismatch repair protein MutL